MDIHGKSVDMDIDMDGKFHIHGKPANFSHLGLTQPHWRKFENWKSGVFRKISYSAIAERGRYFDAA